MAISTTSHADDCAKFRARLQRARDKAKRSRGYNSEATRANLTGEFRRRCKGKSPYGWQLDVTEALILGLDCVVVAGTGSGKTMPFVMPAFISNKIIIVISPLNALETDQAANFRAMGLSARAVNSETYNEELRKELEEFKVQVILTSPEMTENPSFRKLLTSAKFSKQLGLIVVDEAHSISQWGGEFRPQYSQLDKLHAFGSVGVPVLATSATLNPTALEDVERTLKIRGSKSFYLNLGNDRPNITQEVRYMKSATDYAALDFIVEGAHDRASLRRTVVFVNEVSDVHAVARRLRDVVGPNLAPYIGIFHAKRTPGAKQRCRVVLSQNQRGRALHHCQR